MTSTAYVLLTGARNEGAIIGTAIQSVICQILLPRQWLIVSDGSTDETDEIVKSFAKRYPFIHLVRLEREGGYSFAGKASALKHGYDIVRVTEFDYIGFLDADVSFAEDYYVKMIRAFDANKKLGIVGGLIHESHKGNLTSQTISTNSVAGAVQFFRRRCYEECGGYEPLRLGGIDALIENQAKMLGWEVRTERDIPVIHHRLIGVGRGKPLKARFNQGRMYYGIGYNPLFFCLRTIYKLFERPLGAGAALQILGYFWAFLVREKRPVSRGYLKYLQRQQLSRLWHTLTFGGRS